MLHLQSNSLLSAKLKWKNKGEALKEETGPRLPWTVTAQVNGGGTRADVFVGRS